MFLFEQALLEEKQEQEVNNVKRLKLKKSWKNNSLVICVNLSV